MRKVIGMWSVVASAPALHAYVRDLHQRVEVCRACVYGCWEAGATEPAGWIPQPAQLLRRTRQGTLPTYRKCVGKESDTQ